MTKLIHQTGDIFTTTAQAIGHGVNIKGAMASGIAVQFRDRFPQMHTAYKVLCKQGHLGTGQVMVWTAFEGHYIYNISSQDFPGANARLEWLRDGVKSALEHAEEEGLSMIALPRIGSGIGGLNQDDVEAVLLELAENSAVDIELWTYSQ
jgi:O-acetyl-ADP-ribose deacetylase (regulator of RNase III)